MLIEFCLPIYNEEQILETNILQLLDYCNKQDFKFDWKIVIIINGSSDKSFNIASKLAQTNNQINIVNFKKAGKGLAIKEYFKISQADIALYMDIDLAVNLTDTNNLLKALIENSYDLAIGSRLLNASKIKRSWLRELTSQSYNLLSRLILNHKISDLQCGFKAVNINVFKKIAPYIQDEKWFFDTELVILAKTFNYKIKEIPVDWSENRYDKRKSKVKVVRDSLKFIKNLLNLRQRLKKITIKQTV